MKELPVAYPFVEILPDRRVLVVGARAHWRPAGPEHNALVYDESGAVVAEGTLGDGIEHVQMTTSGDIWIGYFDEGVYGNFGWGGRNRLVLGRLKGGRTEREATVRLVLPNGDELPAGTQIYGRGGSLHLLDGRRWFRLDPLG